MQRGDYAAASTGHGDLVTTGHPLLGQVGQYLGRENAQVQWRTPDHQAFSSGHLTFDRQVDLITTGNVACTVQGAVQRSSYTRPDIETECNNRQFPQGQLRDKEP